MCGKFDAKLKLNILDTNTSQTKQFNHIQTNESKKTNCPPIVGATIRNFGSFVCEVNFVNNAHQPKANRNALKQLHVLMTRPIQMD